METPTAKVTRAIPVSPFLQGAVAITPPMKPKPAPTMPLSRTLLCMHCEHLSEMQATCPRCGSSAWLILANWAQRPSMSPRRPRHAGASPERATPHGSAR